MRLDGGDSNKSDNMRRMLRDFVGRRRPCPFQEPTDGCHTSYKRFRRWIIQRSDSEGPAASTPLATGRQCESSFEFDSICQRLELDSSSGHHEPAQIRIQGNQESTLVEAVSHCGSITPHIMSASKRPVTENAPDQRWLWTTSAQARGKAPTSGCDEIRSDLQPFAVLNEASVSLQGKPAMKLAAPSLLNDYYTNLLDCSCDGVVALALSSSVYLWSSETRSLVGHLDPSPQPGRRCSPTQSVSSLCWSRDGRVLCIGTRRGEIQLWEVEQQKQMRFLKSHLAAVGGLSWKQQQLSSGSVLGRIHHHDPRLPAPLVGAAVQQEGLCSLQWSPGDDWLASGSTDGHLHIWDDDITGLTRPHRPVTTMKQPSAVKAMGWCPWQRKMIATGGGWDDGQLRIWDTQSGVCVTSADTNSQICCLRWAERKRRLVTGHGRPEHQAVCWDWEFPSLSPAHRLTGHSQRVLHLAVNPDATQIYSAGADQCVNIWDM